MGLGYWYIKFESSIPSLDLIREKFRLQTGLYIHLIADLHLPSMKTDPTEIVQDLAKDAGKLAEIKEQERAILKKMREAIEKEPEYEQKARIRDDYKRTLSEISDLHSLSRISYVRFYVFGFYEIPFEIEGNTLKIEVEPSSGYALCCFLKVLHDLGGKSSNPDGKLFDGYPSRWKKLKRWNEYRWYNRPKK